MFCTNCGVQLPNGVNFCPNCGAKVVVPTTPVGTVNQGNMVMLVSLGTCSRTTGAALLHQVCGYTADEALLIVDSAPITVARGLNDAQTRMLAQAFTEYGMEVAVYDGDGWRELESSSSSVWDQTGALIASVASALGLMSLNNRITRDMMHRMDYPYRYAGARPPVYRLNSTLRAAPRRIAPAPVRPPVHAAPARPAATAPKPIPRPAPHAAPPRPAPAPQPRPAPAPRNVAPQPVRPAAPTPQPVRPAAPAPQPVRPAARPGQTGGPGGRTGNGNPGGRPGGGTGRRG